MRIDIKHNNNNENENNNNIAIKKFNKKNISNNKHQDQQQHQQPSFKHLKILLSLSPLPSSLPLSPTDEEVGAGFYW